MYFASCQLARLGGFRRTLTVGGLVLGLLWTAPSQAAELAQLDVLQAYQLALDHDRRFQAVKAQLRSEREALPQAQSRLLPAATMTVNRSRIDQSRDDGLGTILRQRYNSDQDVVSLRQAVYSPKLVDAKNQAQAQVLAAEAGVEAERLNLLGRVSEAYFNVVLASEKSGFIQQQIQIGQSRIQAAELALAAGTGTRTDILEIRTDVDMLQAQLIQARQAIAMSENELASLVGRPRVRVRLVDVAGFQNQRLALPEIDSMLDHVLSDHPEIVQRKYQWQASEFAISAAQSDHWPSADLLLQKSRSVGDSSFFFNSKINAQSLGVQVTVPLYQGGLVDSKVRQAVAQEQEAQERLRESEQRLQNEFRKSFLSVQEQQARVQALHTAIASAQLSVQANKRSVLAGARSPLDVLLAEQKLAQANMQMSDARNQAILAWIKTMTWADPDHEAVLRRLSAWLVP